MADTKPPSAAADKMAKALKDTLAQRRPRPWKAVLLALAICTLSLAAMTWWFYPTERLDPLQIVAMDELIAPDEKLHVRAQLYAAVNEPSPRRLHGLTIVFLEPPPLVQQAGATLKVLLKSDEHGQASTEWPTPKTVFAEFNTHHLGEGALSIDHARAFIYLKDAPLFLVDVDETLMADEVDDAAAKTLARAAEAGWRFVYLSVNGDKPANYRKTRDWTIAQAKLPRGPILGRKHWLGAESNNARRDLLKSLRGRFTGEMVMVVKSADAALASREAEVRTYQISAEPLAGVVGVGSWADVPTPLKK